MSQKPQTNQPSTPMDERANLAFLWAKQALKLEAADFSVASADASFRRYFRLRNGEQTWIVMDAPVESEDSAPFVRIANLLCTGGINAPKILAADLSRGFLLLSDMGNDVLLPILKQADAAFADQWMKKSVDTLVELQKISPPADFPRYDEKLLTRELQLFPDWYLEKHLGLKLNSDHADMLQDVFEKLIHRARAQPQVLVHRDFMPRNLMKLGEHIGVLDFQDAVSGPMAYDVLSLFKDAFHSWDDAQVTSWRNYYCQQAEKNGLPLIAAEDFEQDFDWIGIQRHLKILGIFARLNYRDGKTHYLEDTPRFVGYILQATACYPELNELKVFFEDVVVPALDRKK